MIRSHNTWQSFKHSMALPRSLIVGILHLHSMILSSLICNPLFFNMRMKSNCMWTTKYFRDLKSCDHGMAETISKCIVGFTFVWISQVGGNGTCPNHGASWGWMSVLNIELHEDNIEEQVDWPFRFDSVHVLSEPLAAWQFPVWQCLCCMETSEGQVRQCLHEAIFIANLLWSGMASF